MPVVVSCVNTRSPCDTRFCVPPLVAVPNVSVPPVELATSVASTFKVVQSILPPAVSIAAPSVSSLTPVSVVADVANTGPIVALTVSRVTA